MMRRGVVGVMLFLVITFMAMGARAEKQIGILMFSQEPRYVESQKGIMEQLGKNGYVEPAVRFTVETAQGSKAKAAELVQKFVAARMDLIFTMGTSATVATAKEIKDIPIVFSIVFDPIEVGIAKDWQNSGNNTTGVSTKVPMSRIASVLKGFAPVKRLAVLYTPGEKNSELQLKELQAIQADSEIRVVPVIVGKKEDVAQIMPEVVRSAEAIYITGSNIVGAMVSEVVEMASQAKVATITHLDDLVDRGVLLGVCTNSYHAGLLAGEKAIKILQGAEPSSIPIEPETTIDIILNIKTAQSGRFQIPSSFMDQVTKKVE